MSDAPKRVWVVETRTSMFGPAQYIVERCPSGIPDGVPTFDSKADAEEWFYTYWSTRKANAKPPWYPAS